MKHLIISILVFTLLGTIEQSALCQGNGNGSEELYRFEWKLISAAGAIVPSTSVAKLAFTPGQVNRVTGSTGCNRLTGSFELSSSRLIKFSPTAVTRMACADKGKAAIETKLLNTLAKATNWSIAGKKLTLKAGNKALAVFIGQQPAAAEQTKLNGTWQLKSISGTSTSFNNLFPQSKPTLIINLPSAEVSGNGSCNGYGSSIILEGNKITFSDPLSTMMACPGGGEPVYFKALSSVTSYKLETDYVLTLLVKGTPMLTFEKNTSSQNNQPIQ